MSQWNRGVGNYYPCLSDLAFSRGIAKSSIYHMYSLVALFAIVESRFALTASSSHAVDLSCF
jgi:hypothetical protein